MGPYPHVLITIDVYKRIQNMSAISQAVLEKSYQQVTNLGSPRKAWTLGKGRSWTKGGTYKDLTMRPGVFGYAEYDGGM